MGAGFSIIARGNSEADVFIYEDIGASFFGGVTAKQFAEELKGVGRVDTINTRINSGGGDVFDGMAIYNQLVQHPARVISHIDGLAASIASVIAMAGEEIRIAESGFMMIHNAAGGVLGGSDEMRRMADLLDKVTGSIADVYVERTSNDREAITGMMDAETWMTGDEAVSQGFADIMVANLHISARADLTRHRFRHVPTALSTSPPPAVVTARPIYDTTAASVARMRAQVERRRVEQFRPA